VILPEDEQVFLCNALAQLEPDVRPVFTARMVGHLQVIADPGPGDVDRALRAAWAGLWTPPETIELRATSRWDRDAPGFERASKRA
jgi:hypothetical protein